MDPRLQDAKGRIKEATGALVGDEDMKASGAADQKAAKATKAVQDATKGAKDAVNRGADSLKGAIDNAANKLNK